MSNLSGQQINQSYQGLLKLSDSTTGITSTFQTIEDGLGNSTGVRIKQNALTSPNILNLPRFSPPKGGLGILQSSGVQYATDDYDSFIAIPFFDTGVNSYSAYKYSISAATTTGDVCEVGFYTSQYDTTYGIIPYELIMTGGTLTTNSTGAKTLTLSQTLSFSGYGSGIYYCLIKTTNSGTTPTVKFRNNLGQSNIVTLLNTYYGTYGLFNSTTTSSGVYTTTNCIGLWNGSVVDWEPVFTGSTLTTYAPYQVVGMSFPGFELHRQSSI